MNSLINVTFAMICDVIKRDVEGQVGMCNIWSGNVLRFLDRVKDKLVVNIEYEARETEVSNSVYHTFIRISIEADGETQTFLMDGVGTIKHQPYFGKEEDAPTYLKNSQSDRINLYRKT